MKIGIVGIGYVGLAYTILLAQHNKVYPMDVDREKLELLKQRKINIQEEKMRQMLLRIPKDNIVISDEFEKVCKDLSFILVSVPTDYDEEEGKLDLSCIKDVVRKIISANPKLLIVIKSTMSIGATELLNREFRTNKIIYSPEFLREDTAFYDVTHPSRIVIGCDSTDNNYRKYVEKYVDSITKGLEPKVNILYMKSKEAEAVKLFSNGYLAMRVAFFNELDNLSLSKDMNTAKIIQAMSYDDRIGKRYNIPSFGYGGYCLPKDTKQLAKEFCNVPGVLISAIDESNTMRKEFIAQYIIRRIRAYENKISRNITIGIYRIVMKKNSDNIREAAILDVIKIISKERIQMIIHEPTIASDSVVGLSNIHNIESFFEQSDVIVTDRLTDELELFNGEVITADIGVLKSMNVSDL